MLQKDVIQPSSSQSVSVKVMVQKKDEPSGSVWTTGSLMGRIKFAQICFGSPQYVCATFGNTNAQQNRMRNKKYRDETSN